MNLLRQDFDSEYCVIFINLNPMGLHHIFFSWYLKNPIHTTTVILKINQQTIAEQTHLKTPFFHGPFVRGIKLIYVFVNQLTVYLGSIYLELFDYNLLQLFMFVILLVCAYSQGCGLALVIKMNIDSTTNFRIALTHYVHAV